MPKTSQIVTNKTKKQVKTKIRPNSGQMFPHSTSSMGSGAVQKFFKNFLFKRNALPFYSDAIFFHTLRTGRSGRPAAWNYTNDPMKNGYNRQESMDQNESTIMK